MKTPPLPANHPAAASAIDRLLDVMAKLRHPESGCPWDKEQTFATIAPYTIEEAYEVADAIERQDMAALEDELGDLLFQVVFYARTAEESGRFGFAEIADGISDKMLRRHPHVFGDRAVRDADAQGRAWEDHKAAERAERAPRTGRALSVLDGVARALPALMRAQKVQKRAARVGFDWPEPAQIFDKIEEEIREVRDALALPAAADAREEEIGDLLFACVNLARHLSVDAEAALRRATAKFERRFHRVEAALAAAGRNPTDASLDEMDRLWDEAKLQEKSRKPV